MIEENMIIVVYMTIWVCGDVRIIWIVIYVSCV